MTGFVLPGGRDPRHHAQALDRASPGPSLPKPSAAQRSAAGGSQPSWSRSLQLNTHAPSPRALRSFSPLSLRSWGHLGVLLSIQMVTVLASATLPRRAWSNLTFATRLRRLSPAGEFRNVRQRTSHTCRRSPRSNSACSKQRRAGALVVEVAALVLAPVPRSPVLISIRRARPCFKSRGGNPLFAVFFRLASSRAAHCSVPCLAEPSSPWPLDIAPFGTIARALQPLRRHLHRLSVQRPIPSCAAYSRLR